MKTKVLFRGVHNSARSQMAEAFLNHLCPDDFIAESAGLEPDTLNPLVVQVMLEVGIDISQKGTQGVFELFRAGQLFSHVISVCHEANAERCPVFPGFARYQTWSFPDPSAVTGSQVERLAQIRDLIEAQVKCWCTDESPFRFMDCPRE
ncbi:MAG: arsenate reductase ArsC [Luteolibacter sp.]